MQFLSFYYMRRNYLELDKALVVMKIFVSILIHLILWF